MMFVSLIRGTVQSGPDSRKWPAELTGATDLLSKLSASTEKEFLDLGENLQAFYRRTKEMSQLSSQVAERLAGSEMNQGIEGLRALLEQIKSQTGQSLSGTTVLSAMLDRFDNIRLHLGYFDRTIKNLLALCNMIRIESARLGEGETNFATVSDEVKKLAAHMALKSSDLTDRLVMITNLIRQHLQRIADFEKKEQGQARLILDNTAKYLDAITKRHDLSATMLGDISSRWVNVSKSIGEVVMSLQFHDITRQRIEHICEALGEVKAKMKDPAPENATGATHLAKRFFFKKDGYNNRALADIAAIPCELQLAQLKHAEEDLLTAMDRINVNLRGVASDMGRMTADTLQAAGGEDSEGQSFLAELENGLALLIKAISAYSGIHQEWTASLKQVTETVGDMSSFIKEIVRIGVNMRIIALNACIHAARIGDEGLALGVLAESIHQLSTDTSQNINTMSDNLSAIIEETESLSGQEASELSLKDGASRMEDRITAIMEPLRKMNEEQTALLNEIEDNSSTLSRDMDETLARMARHDRFRKGIDSVVLRMEALLEEMHAVLPENHAGSNTQELTSIQDRYTMEQERQVHESILGPRVSVATALPAVAVVSAGTAAAGLTAGMGENQSDQIIDEAQAAPLSESDSEDLGDNIELF